MAFEFFFFFFEKAHLKVETKSKLQVVSGYDRVTQRAQRSPDHTHTDSPHNFLHPRRTWITEAQKLLEAFFFKKQKTLLEAGLSYNHSIRSIWSRPIVSTKQHSLWIWRHSHSSTRGPFLSTSRGWWSSPCAPFPKTVTQSYKEILNN